jgi:isopenicillin N synthase-like dioxygenase
MTNTSLRANHFQQLPIIDLSAADRGPQARGPGVSDGETAALLDATHRFFALPEDQRLAIDNVGSPHFRGYTRTGDERTGGSRDWRDQLDMGAERPARLPGPGEPAYWWLEGPNQWPAALPELRTAALAWIDRLSSVAGKLRAHPLVAARHHAELLTPA